MEGQRHLVSILGKCKYGVSRVASDSVKCALGVLLCAAPLELGLQKLRRNGN